MEDKELIRIYEECGGDEFMKACNHIKTLVPQTIYRDGIEFHHFAVHYDPINKMFAYFNAKIEPNFIYMTQQRANASQRKTPL